MKILYCVLFLAAVCFYIIGFMGHTAAWGAAALSFFAATMIVVGQRNNKDGNDETPYWRTLKANGELNEKYPGGVEIQKEKLEIEGHTIIQKGRKNIRYYVKDFENFLFDLK